MVTMSLPWETSVSYEAKLLAEFSFQASLKMECSSNDVYYLHTFAIERKIIFFGSLRKFYDPVEICQKERGTGKWYIENNIFHLHDKELLVVSWDGRCVG